MAARFRLYDARRDFARTPEPSSREVGETAPGSFVVHKHDARRLHYDVRLEHEGALLSWAVPKGPSLDPSVRRLAVRTEDHPLAYGEFEGRIPAGEYGAGDSLIWDRGSWETQPPGQAAKMLEKGHLTFELHGQKLRGRWHLIRTGPRTGPRTGASEQWLFFKGKDEEAAPEVDLVAERPESVVSGRRATRGPPRKGAARPAVSPLDLLLRCWPPMLATLSAPPLKRPEEWILEAKYDGFRALGARSGGQGTLQSRNGLDLSTRFPWALPALLRLEASELVVDGELVALDRSGAPSFQLLGEPSAQHRYVLFDLLWLDGEDLRGRPLSERRELLDSVLVGAPAPLELAERFDPPLDAALEAARRRGLEGLIAKRASSVYEGRRSPAWLKLKLSRTDEVVILGYTPQKGPGSGIGALLLGVEDGSGLRYAGKVGTGFSEELRTRLEQLLARDRVEQPQASGAPRSKVARWVRPRHGARVTFTEWTADGRLRHPSFQRFLEDRLPGREPPVTGKRRRETAPAQQPPPVTGKRQRETAPAQPPASHRRRKR